MARPPLPNIEGLTSLKVDGFYPDTRKDEVWDFFRKCGRIGDVYLPKEPGTQKNRGFAFVRFYDKKDAEMAVQDMDGREFQGQRLRVNFAQVGRNTDAPTSRSYASDKKPSRRSPSRRSSRSRSRSGGRGSGRGGGRGRSDSRGGGRGRGKRSRSSSRASSRSAHRGRKR